MVVVDACVIAKIYLDEPDSDQTRALLDEYDQILAPRVIRMEVASAITKRFRISEIDETTARLAYARWKKHVTERWFKLIPDEEVMDDAVALSLKLKHPVADCLYLAVAQRFKVTLVTADEVFHRRCHTQYKKLRLLGEMQA